MGIAHDGPDKGLMSASKREINTDPIVASVRRCATDIRKWPLSVLLQGSVGGG